MSPTPRTGLTIGAGTVRDLPAEACRPAWGDARLVPDLLGPAKAADVAPPLVEADESIRWELEVTRLVARGLGTSRIAATLHVSPHRSATT